MCAVLCTPGAFPLLLLLLLAAAFLPSDCCCCPAVTPAAAVALPPPVPLGKKTQRFRELLQNTLKHTFGQCTQHSSSISQTGTEGVIKHKYAQAETHIYLQTVQPLSHPEFHLPWMSWRPYRESFMTKQENIQTFCSSKKLLRCWPFSNFTAWTFDWEKCSQQIYCIPLQKSQLLGQIGPKKR